MTDKDRLRTLDQISLILTAGMIISAVVGGLWNSIGWGGYVFCLIWYAIVVYTRQKVRNRMQQRQLDDLEIWIASLKKREEL